MLAVYYTGRATVSDAWRILYFRLQPTARSWLGIPDSSPSTARACIAANRGAEHFPTAALAVVHAARGDAAAARRVAERLTDPRSRGVALTAVAGHFARIPVRPLPAADPAAPQAPFTRTVEHLALAVRPDARADEQAARILLHRSLTTAGWYHALPVRSPAPGTSPPSTSTPALREVRRAEAAASRACGDGLDDSALEPPGGVRPVGVCYGRTNDHEGALPGGGDTMNAAPDAAGSGGTAGGAAADLAVQGDKLKRLADDLDTMQEVLKKQLLRMDEIVDGIEAGWRGPASEAYRAKHRAAAEDAARIRQTMKILASAVRLSKGGFTAQELEILDGFRRVRSEADIQAEADDLSTPGTVPTPPTGPGSRLDAL